MPRLEPVKSISIILAICFGIYFALQFINLGKKEFLEKNIYPVSVASWQNCDLPKNIFKTSKTSDIMPSNLTEVTPVFSYANSNQCIVKWKPLGNISKKEEENFNACVRNNSDPKPVFRKSIQHLDWTITSSFFSFLRIKNEVFIVEIGGFTGQLLKKLIPVTGAKHYVVVEPVPSFYKRLTSNLKQSPINSSIKTYNFGLGREYRTLAVSIQGDATSLLKDKSQKKEYIKIVSVVDFFVRLGVGCRNIDLLTINCEGCEFDVLETLLSTTLIEKVEYIQFQPHHTVPNLGDYTCRYCRLRQLLMRTHEIAYEYPHVWETWKKKQKKV